MRLSRAMIGVLPEDDDLRIRITRIMKGVKDCVHIRIDMMRPILIDEELPELAVIRLLELWIEQLRPVIMKDFHA